MFQFCPSMHLCGCQSSSTGHAHRYVFLPPDWLGCGEEEEEGPEGAEASDLFRLGSDTAGGLGLGGAGFGVGGGTRAKERGGACGAPPPSLGGLWIPCMTF